MKSTAFSVGRSVAERLSGKRPSRWRAATAAMLAGGTTATLTYKLLRTGEE